MKDSQFSQREKEVIDLLIQGKSNKQIALTLHIAQSTVEYHLKNIYQKLDVHSRTEAVLRLGKSIGTHSPGELRESIVETDRKDVDNDDKSLMLRRFPMNQKSLAIVGLLVLIFSLVAVSILRRMPAQATAITQTSMLMPKELLRALILFFTRGNTSIFVSREFMANLSASPLFLMKTGMDTRSRCIYQVHFCSF